MAFRARYPLWYVRCLALCLVLSGIPLCMKLAARKKMETPLKRTYNAQHGARNALNFTASINSTSSCANTASRIPKILHLTFASEMVYGNYKDFLRRCLALNPDWRMYLWRDSDSERFIRAYYPSFAGKFDSYRGDLQKSDAVRYAVLHRFGGVYLDMDVDCVRPLFPGLQHLSAFVDRERWEQSVLLYNRPLSLMNSAMGGAPGHPFFLFVLNRLTNFAGQYPVDSTGPGALTKIFADWLRANEAKNASEVTVLKSEVFSGIVDPDNPVMKSKCQMMSGEFRNPSPDVRKRLAAELAGFDPDRPSKGGRDQRWMACASLTLTDWHSGGRHGNSTIGVHRFLHLGYRFASSKRQAKFNLLTEFPNRVRVPDGGGGGFIPSPTPPC